MAQQGWVAIHRKITETELWRDDEPFCKRAAWVDLILVANHEERDVWMGTKTVRVERGCFLTSRAKLAARWHWSERKVRTFLESLQNLGMIELKVTNKWTAVTLVNYGIYQEYEPKSGQQMTNKWPANDQQTDNKRTASGQQKTTNNNDITMQTMINNAAARACEEQNSLGGVNAIDHRPTLPGVNAIGSSEAERDLAWACRVYEQNLGTFDGLTAEKIAALLEEVGPEVYERAVNRAKTNHAPRIRYVEAVARGLHRGVDFERSQAKCGDIWGEAYRAYLGGAKNGENKQG